MWWNLTTWWEVFLLHLHHHQRFHFVYSFRHQLFSISEQLFFIHETAAHPGRHFLTFFFNDGWIWNSFLIYFDRTTSRQTLNIKKNNNNIFYLTGQINTTNFEVELLDFFVVVLILESTVLWRSPKCFINSTLFYESPPPPTKKKKKNIFVMIMLCGLFLFLFFFRSQSPLGEFGIERVKRLPTAHQKNKKKKIILFCFCFFEFWRF